jgi:hypothetical protein
MSQSVATRMWTSVNEDMSSAVPISFNQCSLAGKRLMVTDNGHRGSRQRTKCRTRLAAESASGSFGGNFAPNEIDAILPWVLGNTGALRPENGIKPIYAVVEKINETYPATVARRFKYHKLHINSLTISGSTSNPINWEVSTIGTHEESGVSAPAGNVSCDSFYIFPDVVFTYSGTAYPIRSFSLTINNFIDTNPYENSLRPTRFEASDCGITLAVQCEYNSDTEALYRASLDGAAATLAFSAITLSNASTAAYSFAFHNLKIPNGEPTIGQRGRLTLPLQMEAFRKDGDIVPSTNGDNALFITKTVA